MRYRAIGAVIAVLVFSFALGCPAAWADSITAVTSPSELGSYAATDLTALGAASNTTTPTYVPSPSTIDVPGTPGLTVTFSTITGQDFQRLDECGPTDPCPNGLEADFPVGTPTLYTDGQYNTDGDWIGNGPVTISFSNPILGIGFLIAANAYSPFTATLCAYNSSNVLLAPCSIFDGDDPSQPGASAPFVGLFDNSGADISYITVSTAYSTEVDPTISSPNDFSFSSPLITTPEPGTLVSLAAGLLGLVAFGFCKNRKSFRLSS